MALVHWALFSASSFPSYYLFCSYVDSDFDDGWLRNSVEETVNPYNKNPPLAGHGGRPPTFYLFFFVVAANERTLHIGHLKYKFYHYRVLHVPGTRKP
jgi:hypothetical protein